MRYLFFIFLILLCCESKKERKPSSERDSTTLEVTYNDGYEKVDTNYDYSKFYGIFDHESTTNGFSAILSLKQSGHDLYFTLSVAQGDCKKESEGVIMILDSAEKFPTGFYQSDNCRLQFTFAEANTTVDVKEITLCGLDGAACSFEGMYKKRAN